MATVQCSKCTAERKGFRRELDSWRHKLIHCVGFESILEGIYGPMLLQDLNLFDAPTPALLVFLLFLLYLLPITWIRCFRSIRRWRTPNSDCEPEEVDDWSPEASCSQCSFCNLPLDKLSDNIPAATTPLSSPSDYSPCQISESSQSAHRFLQAVFHKKNVPLGCESNIPLVAQELMKKMIHQFAKEYASKCLLHTSTNGVTTRTSSLLSETTDAPLDLTVSRNEEEKESQPEPEGVLDLSNRNSARSTIASSSNEKTTGPLPSEELSEPEQRGNKYHQSSVLDAVFRSLCPAHRSLLYQILKLAHQEKMLSFLNHRPVDHTKSYFCPHGGNSQDNGIPLAVRLSECKAHNSSPYYSLNDCGHQGQGSTTCHPGDSKSSCSIHHYPLNGCKSKAPLGSSHCCVQRCRMESYTVLCPKSPHCISCQSLAKGRINTFVCSFASSSSNSSSLCTPSSTLCPSSTICCKQHSPYSCPCCSNHSCLTQIRNTMEIGVGDGDPPVLNREQSPSPPLLLPVSSDIDKKTDEKPPSLVDYFHHGQEAEADLVKNALVNVSNHTTNASGDEDLQCRTPTEQNPNGTLLQDVVNRFSEKLETIRPVEKDPSMVSTAVDVSGNEPTQLSSTSQKIDFHADAHLTEIITNVLHEGGASDYSLSELFNRHDSKEPKSPNTRSRRRQEVLAAIATPANDASTRRRTIQFKRELAMLDQSYNGRKGPPAKRTRLKDINIAIAMPHTSSESNLVKEDSKRERETREKPAAIHRVREEQLIAFSAKNDLGDVKDNNQTSVILTEDVHILNVEEKERKISSEENDTTLSTTQILAPGLQRKYVNKAINGYSIQTQAVPSGQSSDKKSHKGEDCCMISTEKQTYQSDHSMDERRSKRNIVPPQRFSSYVTEPRKMFFVACFSDNIFNQKTQKDNVLTSSPLDAISEDPDAKDTRLESRNEAPMFSPENTERLAVDLTHRPSHTDSNDQCCVSAAKEKSHAYNNLNNKTVGRDYALKSFGRLRSSSKSLQVSNTALGRHKNSSLASINCKSATCVDSPSNSQVQYASPIKLMFVSPVKDKEGIRYSLKSAGSGINSQADETFDPYEVSSWSGTPEKQKGQSTKSVTSQVKSVSSPAKSAKSSTRSVSSPPKYVTCVTTKSSSPNKSMCSPGKSTTPTPKSASPSKPVSSPAKSTISTPKSASPSKSVCSPAKSTTPTPKSASPVKLVCSPAKSATSTPKSVSSPRKSLSSPTKSATSIPKLTSSPRKSASSSPKSGSLSPKMCSRKAGEVTPSKRTAGSESQRSPCNIASFHENTPPKRRPGRPKKLGPQLEQKVKRPIGRPRKQKAVDSVIGTKIENNGSILEPDVEENINKNLKITVVYGRSRRNKRMVSESFDQLQTEFHDAWHAAGLKSDLGILMPNFKTSSGDIEMTSTDLSEDSPPPSSGRFKCQKRDNSVPLRKPGRPAKVKISGISVTVTTVSPRQRKIHIMKDIRQSPQTLLRKKVLMPQFKFAKEPVTISHHSVSKNSQMEKRTETKEGCEDKLLNQPIAVRHSMRVRKPSIHFLHAVATSRSYKHSNALLRRSKQLLNKANNERRKEEAQSNVETLRNTRKHCGHERKNMSQDLSRVAGVSVDSIFTPKKTLRWWAASAEEKTMNHELARRIRLISDTWVSDAVENLEKEIPLDSDLGTKSSCSFTRKSKHSSVVRTLFDCSPNKPRSCSMHQLCSWFMETTETQSLAIVKKASSRNPYELMHFPRSANKKSVCPSPQAERLRKHIKKFAKTMPKSPLQHQQAMLKRRNKAQSIKRQLFTHRFVTDRLNHRVQCLGSRAFNKYKTTLFRARTRFQNLKERKKWQERHKNSHRLQVAKSRVVNGPQSKHIALRRLKHKLPKCLANGYATSSVDNTQESVDVQKEQNICSKAWSPETLKECRVFLRKINSPDNESTEEEWDTCTVTLDNGSPSAYLFAGGKRELVGVVKAVKTRSKTSMKRGTAPTELAVSAPNSVQEQEELPASRQKGKYKSPGIVSTETPPAKTLRQSRMRGLTGPRWCDFVFEN